MGSPHPKARPAASQEGSGNLHELFKKADFSWDFEGDGGDFGTIVANRLDHPSGGHGPRTASARPTDRR
jgi:hypothetical protein